MSSNVEESISSNRLPVTNYSHYYYGPTVCVYDIDPVAVELVMTIDEAKRLPKDLGVFAPAALRAFGEYIFRLDGVKHRIVRK